MIVSYNYWEREEVPHKDPVVTATVLCDCGIT